MDRIKTFLKEEYVNGYKPFDYAFLAALLIMQIITFIIVPDSPISIIASVLGTIATVLCAKGKISYYVFGFIQTFLFIIIDYQMSFFIDMGEQIFYFITMIYGVYVWKKNLVKTEDNSVEIKAKKLSWKMRGIITIAVFICTYLLGLFGELIGSHQPFTDSFSNILAVFANFMCILCYKEQWILWFLIDIADVKMFLVGGNYVMAVMYFGWLLNTIYGWYNWNKTNKG